MPYVQRSPEGKIVALWGEPQAAVTEFLPPDHPEVGVFLQPEGATPESGESFTPAADLRMVRVIEDLIDILIHKNVIVFTDLPAAAREKILAQKHRRERLFGSTSPLHPDEGLL